MLHRGQIAIGGPVVGKLGGVLAWNRQHIRKGPLDTIGRKPGMAIQVCAIAEQRLVAALWVGVTLVADYVREVPIS